jgi:hypothetical protein
MQTVIDISSFEHIQVPDNYIECSVCGQYHAPESYRKSGEDRMTRTNCETCYNLPYVDMQALTPATQKRKQSQLYRTSVHQLQTKILYRSNSISVEDMITALTALPAGARLVITQEGYYADGNLAHIFTPETEGNIDNTDYYRIGHSSQHY